MRKADFQKWLALRTFKNKPLSPTANASRVAWLHALERALPDLGFNEGGLDEVHAAGRWEDMYQTLGALLKDWQLNVAAARKIAPEADDPSGQIGNTHGAARLYGYFADGKDPSYSRTQADDESTSTARTRRPFVLFDRTGGAFQPVRHGERDGRSVFKVKPVGANNEADEAIALDTMADVAKAMLVEGLPARVQAISGSRQVNYVGYGKQKLVRYELDPAIAQQIGVPPTGSVERWGNGAPSVAPSQDNRRMPEATNLILYGPPGTGKTWTTAAEAVRLCDGSAPADREALMARYRELVEARRIDFVTFHQSYSYEEFVEGLRPVTDGGVEAGGEAQGAGFRLEPKRGIFREMCAVAENARKNPGRPGGFDLAGRKLFKMSLGRAGVEDHIFDAAIEGGYVALGWGGDVDWSDPRYDQWSAILDRWQQDDPNATGYDPNVVQMGQFRSSMKEGDLIVISSGNAHFRAIGEVTGPYHFEPTGTRAYNHRRPVRWLLIPDEPLPVEMITAGNS